MEQYELKRLQRFVDSLTSIDDVPADFTTIFDRIFAKLEQLRLKQHLERTESRSFCRDKMVSAGDSYAAQGFTIADMTEDFRDMIGGRNV